jgi:hypothetical protein
VAIIQGKGNHRFVGGADEKVARVFEAPLSFLKTLNLATCQKSSFPENLQVDVQILGANMSALGLSQKPIYVNSECLSPSLYMYVSVEYIKSLHVLILQFNNICNNSKVLDMVCFF